MLGHFDCRTQASFDEVLQLMRRRARTLGFAIYRGQRDTDWLLQSEWERQFLHPQRAGLWEPYYVQPHESAKIPLQREFLEIFRREVEQELPQERGRTDDQLWALGRHHGLITPLLDWTVDPYNALYFALRHRTGTERAVAVWVFHASFTTLPFSQIWDADVFPRIDGNHVSARQQAQQGVFTRLSHPIFAELEQYLRNKLPASCVSFCLVKIEILKSALPRLLRELARRGIDDASLGLTTQSDFGRLDAIAKRCNDALRKLSKPPAPLVGALDQDKICETAERLARRLLETIGPGKARPTGEKMFPFLQPPKPRYIV